MRSHNPIKNCDSVTCDTVPTLLYRHICHYSRFLLTLMATTCRLFVHNIQIPCNIFTNWLWNRHSLLHISSSSISLLTHLITTITDIALTFHLLKYQIQASALNTTSIWFSSYAHASFLILSNDFWVLTSVSRSTKYIVQKYKST